MTRLVTEWIRDLEETAAARDEELRRLTGAGYVELAALTAGVPEELIIKASEEYKVAVVPVTSGLGEIESFTQAVAAVTAAMGFYTFVTEHTDVSGFYEASCRGADIVYMADDDRYIAVNMRTGKIGENDISTACGYAQLLLQLADRKGKKPESGSTAVLGFGRIGSIMAGYLREKGIVPAVYDKDAGRKDIVLKQGFEWIDSIDRLKEYLYILDGTSEGGWLSRPMLSENVLMAAPGIPLSLDDEAQTELDGRYLHDMLETGTAVMMGYALAPAEK